MSKISRRLPCIVRRRPIEYVYGNWSRFCDLYARRLAKLNPNGIQPKTAGGLSTSSVAAHRLGVGGRELNVLPKSSQRVDNTARDVPCRLIAYDPIEYFQILGLAQSFQAFKEDASGLRSQGAANLASAARYRSVK